LDISKVSRGAAHQRQVRTRDHKLFGCVLQRFGAE
jgi:hypothetical protein